MNSRRRKNNVVVCVFAHPDDEAFGPGGTIAKFAQDGDVYIISVTRGEAGGEPEIRERELQESAQILGVKEVFFLDFVDGTLCNAIYHELAQKIESKLEILKPNTLITFEPKGISGHIDHITVSMVTTFVFYRLNFVKKLMYFCIEEEYRKNFGDDYFIYFPPGYQKSEIDLVVGIKDFWDQKVKVMMVHKSQAEDAKRVLKNLRKLPKEEYFMVLEK